MGMGTLRTTKKSPMYGYGDTLHCQKAPYIWAQGHFVLPKEPTNHHRLTARCCVPDHVPRSKWCPGPSASEPFVSWNHLPLSNLCLGPSALEQLVSRTICQGAIYSRPIGSCGHTWHGGMSQGGKGYQEVEHRSTGPPWGPVATSPPSHTCSSMATSWVHGRLSSHLPMRQWQPPRRPCNPP